jgi:hypothetical protein
MKKCNMESKRNYLENTSNMVKDKRLAVLKKCKARNKR